MAFAAMATAVVGMLYGTACEFMAFWNRRPGLPHYSFLLIRDELTERGRMLTAGDGARGSSASPRS